MPTDKVKADLKSLRSAFNELKKQNKQVWRERNKQLKAERKHNTDEIKRIQKTGRLQERQHRKELRALETKNRQVERQYAKEQRHTAKLERRMNRTRAGEIGHVRRMQRELGRGPLGRFQRFNQRAGRIAGAGLGLAGLGVLGFVFGTAMRDYQNYVQAQQAKGQLIGMGSLRGAGKGGSGLGFNIAERYAIAGAAGRATGAVSPIAMMRAQRATGMSTGEVANIFGAMREAGIQFAGTAETFNGVETREAGKGKVQGQREFAKMISVGMYSGLERARLPQYFTGVQNILQQQGRMAAGDISIDAIHQLAGVLGRTGLSGLQGQRGMAVISQIHSALISPQARNDPWLMQAMGHGRGGFMGGGVSWGTARKRLAKGLTDPENFQRIMEWNRMSFGTSNDAALNLEERLGVSPEVAEALVQVSSSGKPLAKQMEEVKKIMDESKSLEKEAKDQMSKAGTNLAHLAGLFDASNKRGAKMAPTIEAIQTKVSELADYLIGKVPDMIQAMQDAARAGRDVAEWFNGPSAVQQITVNRLVVSQWEEIGAGKGGVAGIGGRRGKVRASLAAVNKFYKHGIFRSPVGDMPDVEAEKLAKASNLTAMESQLSVMYATEFAKRNGLNETQLPLQVWNAADKWAADTMKSPGARASAETLFKTQSKAFKDHRQYAKSVKAIFGSRLPENMRSYGQQTSVSPQSTSTPLTPSTQGPPGPPGPPGAQAPLPPPKPDPGSIDTAPGRPGHENR